MPRILLLLPTTSYKAGDFLDAARKLEIEVVVGSEVAPILGQFAPGHGLPVNFADHDRGLRDIAAFAKASPLDAVIGVDENTAVLAAKSARALGLPHNAPEAVAATADKFRFRTAMANSGLQAPQFALFARNDDPRRIAARVDYPCVLKPLSLAASRGVIRANSPDEFAAAFRRIASLLRQPEIAETGGSAKYILVEEYIDGTEVALEGLLMDGALTVLALFDKPDPLNGPYFEETIYVTPSRLAAGRQRDIVETTSAALSHLGLRDGPVHAELRLNAQGAWIVEIGARTIGGLCARSLRFGAGISLEELVLRHAVGMPLPSVCRESQASGVMMIPIPHGGILGTVGGQQEARRIAGIEDLTIAIARGETVVPPPEGDRYLGFIFARGTTPEAVEQSLRDAYHCLDIRIEPGP